MKAQRAIVATMLALAALAVLPTAQAAAPTFDCELTFTPDNSVYDGVGWTNGATGMESGVTTTGGVLVLSMSKEHKADVGRDQVSVGLSTTCGTNWSQPNVCTGAATCDKGPVAADPAGMAAIAKTTRNNVGTVTTLSSQHISVNSGQLLYGTTEADILTNGPCSGGGFSSGPGDGYYSGTGAVIRYAYLMVCGGVAKLVTVNDVGNVVLIANYPASGSGQAINVPGESSTNAYATTAPGGGAVDYRKLNVDTGANIATVSTGGSFLCTDGTREAPKPATLHADSVYVLNVAGGGCGTNQWTYSRITVSSWAVAENAIAFGSAVNNNLPNSGNVVAWDLGGDDNFLACGSYTSGGTHGQIYKLNTDAGHAIDWSVAVDAGSQTTFSQCNGVAFDYTGGFFAWGQYTVPSGPAAGQNAAWVRHYSGGGFTQPPKGVDHSSLYPTPDGPQPCVSGCTTTATPMPGVTDVGGGILSFAQSIGFVSASSLFFFGLLLCTILGLLSGAAYAALAGSHRSGIFGSVVGIGTSLFNILSGIWQVWAGVVFIILASAVVTYVVRRFFAPTSDGGGAGG